MNALWVGLAVVASLAAGRFADARWGAAAHRAGRRAIELVLYCVLPFVAYFNLADLHVSAAVAGGVGLAYVALAIVGVAAWAIATRGFRLSRPATGAFIAAAIQANTGFLGIALCRAVLGKGAVAPATAFEVAVSEPVLFLFAFAIGAAYGTTAGATLGARVRAFLTRNPPLIGAVLGLLAPDALAPHAAAEVTRTIVIGLLPVGFFVVGLNVRFPPPTDAPIVTAAALRVVVAPLVLIALAAPLVHLPPAYRLQAAMPVGVNAIVVAQTFGLDVRLAAGAIAWSTLAAIAVVLVVSLA